MSAIVTIIIQQYLQHHFSKHHDTVSSFLHSSTGISKAECFLWDTVNHSLLYFLPPIIRKLQGFLVSKSSQNVSQFLCHALLWSWNEMMTLALLSRPGHNMDHNLDSLGKCYHHCHPKILVGYSWWNDFISAYWHVMIDGTKAQFCSMDWLWLALMPFLLVIHVNFPPWALCQDLVMPCHQMMARKYLFMQIWTQLGCGFLFVLVEQSLRVTPPQSLVLTIVTSHNSWNRSWWVATHCGRIWVVGSRHSKSWVCGVKGGGWLHHEEMYQSHAELDHLSRKDKRMKEE